jgi:hypothetical protein
VPACTYAFITTTFDAGLSRYAEAPVRGQRRVSRFDPQEKVFDVVEVGVKAIKVVPYRSYREFDLAARTSGGHDGTVPWGCRGPSN